MSRTGTPQAYPAIIRALGFLLLILAGLVWWALGDDRVPRSEHRLTVPATAPQRTTVPVPPAGGTQAPQATAPARVKELRGRIRPVPPSRRFRVWWGPYRADVAVAADGSFRCDKMPVGKPLELDFFFDHAAPITRRVAHRNVDLGLIELDAGLVVDGTVHDDRGMPIEGATVGLHMHGWREAEDRFTKTDAHGRFMFPHLPLGVFDIWTRAEGLVNQDFYDLPLDANRSRAFRLGHCGVIELCGRKSTAHVVEGAERIFVATDEHGGVRVHARPGTYRIGETEFQVYADEVTRVDIR